MKPWNGGIPHAERQKRGQQGAAQGVMMATSQATGIQQGQSDQAAPVACRSSPIAYRLGSFGRESTYKVFWGFNVFFYLDGLGLAVALAAVINVIYAIWDAVNDPLVGYLSDNTHTRWGRRRPWFLTGLPFYIAFLVLTYAVPWPFRQGQSLFLYTLAIILLFETTFTVMSVNYGQLPDQTVLHSVLGRIQDMNLRLISVTEVEANTSDR